MTWKLRQSGCPVHVRIFILCMNHQKALFSSISSLRSASRIFLIATLELGAWCPVSACVLSPFKCIQLCETQSIVVHEAPLSVRFSRQEYWSGLPCPPPGDLPDPGIKSASLMSPALAGGLFHLFKNFPQFFVTYTVKGFVIVNETDVFLEISSLAGGFFTASATWRRVRPENTQWVG